MSCALRDVRERGAICGVIYAHQLRTTVGVCIRDLELIAKAGEPGDLAGQVQFLPL